MNPKRNILLILIFCFLQIVTISLNAQQISVTNVQGLSFGTFYPGTGVSTVTINPNGTRTVTGSVIAAGSSSFSPAIFEIKVHPGSYARIVFGPDVILTGSSGGSMSMHVGPINKTNPFYVPPPGRETIQVGGTLTVGPVSANPAGSYVGTFSITLIEE